MAGADPEYHLELTESVTRLGEFRAETRLKQAARTFMLNAALTMKMAEELEKAFNEWDINGDGFISKSEFITGFKNLHAGLNQDTATAIAVEIFDEADTNQDGNFSFQEWCALEVHKNDRLVEQNLRSSFDNYQKNGTIVIKQVVSIMSRTLRDMIPDEETWMQIVKDADTNKDGQIDFEEFKVMMLNIQDNYTTRQKKRRDTKRKAKLAPTIIQKKEQNEPDDDSGDIKQYRF